ncbi:MAG: hypothetical protein ACRC24_06145 [Vibrionaceae bacterium]
MFKISALATVLSLTLAPLAISYAGETEYFKQVYQDHYQQINQRLSELRFQAESGHNVSVEDGKRFLRVNGIRYPLTADNYLQFEMPKPDFYDETAIRNIFDFFNNDWELTWYEGGVVAVNKLFGNYDYGNGCLIEYIPRGISLNGEFSRVNLETASCQVNSFSSEVKNLALGEHISAEQIGIDPQQVTAIERYNNRLYISQNANPGKVVIVDISTKQVIGEITGITADYNEVSELYIRNNLLYVVSRYSHIVEIFDLDNDHQHVTTIGNSKDLHRAQAVVANDDYVFVTDALEKIKIFSQQDVTAENSTKVPVKGFLNFEGKYSHRFVQMHLLQDYLIVSTAGKNYYIYDLRKLEQAMNDGINLDPEIVISDKSVQKIDTDGANLIVNFNDRIAWFSINDFINNGFQLINENLSFNKFSAQNVTAFKDIHFADEALITANSQGIMVNRLLTSKIAYSADQQVTTEKFIFDELMPSAVNYILDNDEPYETLIDRNLRSVNINSLVKTEILANNTVLITNYAAKELRDINIEGKLHNINKWLVLGQFDRLPAYAQISLPLSAFGENGKFNSTRRDGVFDLNNLLNANVDWSNQMTHRFSSNSDPFAQKISRLKPSWNVRFATETTGSWRPINALYAKEWLIITTNLAYMVSQPEFKHIWFNFKDIMGYEMFGNGGNNYVPNGIFTAADYEHYYHSLMKRPYLNLGITAMGGGLGGGGITGVDTFNFVSHYYGAWGIIAHEFGHGFDGNHYGHDSAFARGSHGWHPLMTVVANYHIRKGDLPYPEDSVNGFYKPEHSQYHYSSINLGARKHRADSHMYHTDHYFMQFSSMPQGWLANGHDVTPEQLDALNNQERLLMSVIPKASEKRSLCRFTFEDGEQYYGYVEQQAGGLRCEAGDLIHYRQSNGQFVPLVSPINQFDWLSLHHKGKLGQPVLHQNGRQLCYKNVEGFYGIGFVNDNDQCTQLPNVYQTNGKHWLTSYGWKGLTYISGDFIQPSEGVSSDFTATGIMPDYTIVNGRLNLSVTLTTANPVNVTVTLKQDGNAVASVAGLIDGTSSLELIADSLSSGQYSLFIDGMAEGGLQGSQQIFELTLSE